MKMTKGGITRRQLLKRFGVAAFVITPTSRAARSPARRAS
jgi:hypothetical protein